MATPTPTMNGGYGDVYPYLYLHKSIEESSRDNAKAISDAAAQIISSDIATSNAVRDQMLALDTHNNTVFDRNFGENRDGQKQIVEEIARLSKQSCQEVGSVSKQLAEGHGIINANLALNRSSIERQACEYKAETQLEALKNKEELAKQLAQCCCEMKQLAAAQHCEIKEKIEARSNQTDLLIRETDSNRIRDDLQQARSELLFNKIKKTCE